MHPLRTTLDFQSRCSISKTKNYMHKNKSNSFYVYPNEIHGSLGYLSLRHKKAISFSLIPTSRFQCQINKDQNQIKTLLKSVNLSFLFLLFIGIHKESPSFTSLWSVYNVCSILVQSWTFWTRFVNIF